MTEANVIEIGRQALQVSLMISAPLLIASLLIGLIVSLFQVATSIQDITLTFVPKIVGVALLLMIFGPWMIRSLVDFAYKMITAIPGAVG